MQKLLISLLLLFSSLTPAIASTIRGDANSDEQIGVVDVFYLIQHFYGVGPPPARICLADANSDEALDVADIFFLINHLFAGGPQPVQGSEVCNSRDDDCDGLIDDGVESTFFPDVDGDGFGTSPSVLACSTPQGHAGVSGDCDDADEFVHPGATEIMGDEIDQDCNGGEICFADGDNDGYRTSAAVISGDTDCADPGEARASEPATDCCDNDPNAKPGQMSFFVGATSCGGWDYNCDADETERFTQMSESLQCGPPPSCLTLSGGWVSAPYPECGDPPDEYLECGSVYDPELGGLICEAVTVGKQQQCR